MSDDKFVLGGINFNHTPTPQLNPDDFKNIKTDVKFSGIKTTPETVTRFEVIDETGRVIVHYGKVDLSFQDNNKTLKLFVKGTVRLPDRE